MTTNLTKLFLLTLLLVSLLACNSDQDARNQISEETLGVADENGIDYVGLYQKAMEGDEVAVEELLLVADRFDAAAGLGHYVTLTQLRDKHGIAFMAAIVRRLPQKEQGRWDWLLAGESVF